jgi:hypothetical protein
VALQESEVLIFRDAGLSALEKVINDALVRATDRFARQFKAEK